MPIRWAADLYLTQGKYNTLVSAFAIARHLEPSALRLTTIAVIKNAGGIPRIIMSTATLTEQANAASNGKRDLQIARLVKKFTMLKGYSMGNYHRLSNYEHLANIQYLGYNKSYNSAKTDFSTLCSLR